MAAAELGSGSRALAVTAQNLKDGHNSLKKQCCGAEVGEAEII